MKDKKQINDPLLCERTNFLKEKNLFKFFLSSKRIIFCEHHKGFAPPGGKAKIQTQLNLFITEHFLGLLGSKTLLGR